jgi:hypothetical protein
MKTFIWKLRYAVEIRRLIRFPWWICWDMAGATVENLRDEIDHVTPKEAAEEERDECLACCD